MKRLIIAAILFLLPYSAWADPVIPAPWTAQPPNNAMSVTATTTSQSFGVSAASPAPMSIAVCNTGSNAAYVTTGVNSAVTAVVPSSTVAGSSLVSAGICRSFTYAPFVAVITGSNTTTLTIETGSGSLALLQGGGGTGSLQTNLGNLLGGVGSGVLTAMNSNVNSSGGLITTAITTLGSLTTAAGGAFGTAAYVNTGTSGGTVPLLNGSPTTTGNWQFNATGSQIALGLNGGPGGNIQLNGGTSASFQIGASAAGAPIMTNVPSSTAALNYMCYNNSTDAITFDSSGTCLVSSLRFKHSVRQLHGNLAFAMAIDPISFLYNDQSVIKGRQEGVTAESMAAADPLSVEYGDDNKPLKPKMMALIAHLYGAVQEQQREINRLYVENRRYRHLHQ